MNRKMLGQKIISSTLFFLDWVLLLKGDKLFHKSFLFYSREFTLGFTLGNVVGMYLAQNYDIPNIAKKLEDFKKDVEAKKKPPSDKS